MHHGEQIQKLLTENQLSIRAFFKLMDGEFSSLTSVYKLLKSDNVSKARLFYICHLFGKPPAYFGLSPEAFKPQVQGSQTIVPSINQRLVSYNFRKNEKKAYEEFVEQYFAQIERFALTTKHSIKIMEYIPRVELNELKKNIGNFHKRNAFYFEKLEAYLEKVKRNKTPFLYSRLAQLSIHIKQERLSFSEKVDHIVRAISLQDFIHFTNCYQKFPDFFQLYVIQNPARLYSFYLFDEKVICNEYLRFDKSGIPSCDNLWINMRSGTPGGDGDQIIDLQLDDFNALTDDLYEQKQITEDHFVQGIFRVSRDLKMQLEKMSIKLGENEALMKVPDQLGEKAHKLRKEINGSISKKIEYLQSQVKNKNQFSVLIEKHQRIYQT